MAELLLHRWGVVFRDLVVHDSLRFPWRDLQWALRRLEDRGLVRGGRFVSGFSGEQYALPAAHEQLTQTRKAPRTGERVTLNATDPLNLVGRDRARCPGPGGAHPPRHLRRRHRPRRGHGSRRRPGRAERLSARGLAGVSTLSAPQHEYRDYAALLDDYHAAGGPTACPSCRPTPELVDEFLAVAGLEPDRVLGAVPTREVVVTAEHVAINAVMAGCRPEYMPVVVAAVRAHLHEKANCHSVTGTLSGASQAVVINGPARLRLDVNCTAGCFGPGWRANATIGRALRLVIRNVCRAIPNFLDRATYSTPRGTRSASARTKRAPSPGCR